MPKATRTPHVICLLAAILAASFLAGCREYENTQANLEAMYASGRFDQAAAALDDPKTRDIFGPKNDVLWKLDRGSVALALRDDTKTIEILNDAENQIEVQRRKSLADTVGQWVINDTAARYIAEPYEDMYVNVVKLLAQLDAGRLEGGATVEARRAAGKADLLRDTYLKYDDAVHKKSGAEASGPPPSVVATNKAGQFIESPLATFLTTVTFMKTGDTELQRVGGKRLIDSLQLERGLVGPVRESDFEGLGELDPDSVNVLIVALSGRGPTKYAQRVGPIPLGTFPVYFELPYLRTFTSEVAGAHLEIDDAPYDPGQKLKLVEDLSAVATENHKRALPLIYTRTLIRYGAKAGISTALTEIGRAHASNSNQGLVQIGGVLAGLAVLGATEKADLRCWIFLPGQARVGLLKLSPGEHRIRVVYESATGGAVYASEWRTIRATPHGLSSVVTQYWR
jgi:hypothetical protein